MPLLVDAFLTKMTSTLQKLLRMTSTSQKPLSKHDDRLLRSGLHAIVSAAKLGDKVIFTTGTMTMLIEKVEHYQQTVKEIITTIGQENVTQIIENLKPYRGGWVEFPKPVENVAAMLFFTPSVYMPTGKDMQQLYLISTQGEIVDALEERIRGEEWVYQEPLHTCPLSRCTREYGVLVPCPHCQERLIVWERIFAMSAIIAGQYLAALRYEEKEITTMRHVPREKSGQERRVPVKHTFKVIDANEIIIPVQKEAEAEALQRETRGSWMDGTEVYEEIRTRPFSRTYTHPRYVNVRGQTVEFPEGIKRLQPKKAENLGKTVTKVKASLYE